MTDHSERWDLVAQRLNEQMARRGIDQAELVRRSGLSANIVRELQNGITRGSRRRKTLSALAIALELPGDYFDNILAGEDPGTYEETVTVPSDMLRQLMRDAGWDVAEQPIVIPYPDGTQVLIELKVRGTRHAEILAQARRLLERHAAGPHQRLVAAKEADIEQQTVQPRRRPGADAPEEQGL